MLSAQYPIIHTLSGAPDNTSMPYAILIGTEPVYSGKVYSRDGGSVEINISPIIRQYLEVFPEYINLSEAFSGALPGDNLIQPTQTFIVESDYGTASYNVGYDYNKEWVKDQPNSRCLNLPVTNLIDPRQFIGVSSVGNYSTSYFINGSSGGQITVTGTTSYGAFQRRVSSFNLSTGDKLTFVNNGVSMEYELVKECPNRYSLIYVNSMGGLDYLLCSGRSERSWTPSRIDIRSYPESEESQQFEQRRIHSDISQRYNLNTGLIGEKGSGNIEEFINSPKVFIHDLDTDIVRSVIVNTSSVTEKKHKYYNSIYYDFQVEDSKLYIRK